MYVDHDPSFSSAQGICDTLNEQGFGARVEHDHAMVSAQTSSFVVSIFTVNDIDDHSVERLTIFLSSLPKEKIERFELNNTSNQLMVIHNPLFVTAVDLVAEVAAKAEVATILKVDGDEGKLWEFTEVDEDEALPTAGSHFLRPTVVLSGIFWIISMLSYIGGKW